MSTALEFAEATLDHCRAVIDQSGDSPGGALTSGTDLSSILGDERISERSYSQFNSRVYSAIRAIAEKIASQHINVGRIVGRGGSSRQFDKPTKASLPSLLKSFSEEIEIIPNHPLVEKFRMPNAVMPMWHLQYMTICSYKLTGVSYYWMPEEEGEINIWPVPSTWITPKHENGKYFTSYEIKPGGSGRGIVRPGSEFARFVNPDPADPFGFKSPLRAQSLAVQADEAIESAQVAAFKNGIMPTFALTIGDIDDAEGKRTRPLLEIEDRDRITRGVMDMYSNVYQAGTPLLLDALITDINRITQNVAEMDFLQSGKVTDSRISRGFGTPAAITGELEHVNRAGSAVARAHFIDFTVNPLIEYMSQILTMFVGPRFAANGEQLVVWLTPARPDDPEVKRDNIALLAKHQAISKNEMRMELEGLAPIVDGDAIPKPMNVEDVPVEPERKTTGVNRKSATLMSYDGKRKRFLKQHDKIETSYVGDLTKIFVTAGKKAAEHIRNLDFDKAATVLPEAVAATAIAIGGNEFNDLILATSTQHMLASIVTGTITELNDVTKAAPDMGILIDVQLQLPPEIQSSIAQELATIMKQPYWGEIADTVLNDVASTISAGINEGLSTKEIAKLIEGPNGVMGQASSKARALRIARTEITGSLNAGHFTARESLVNQGLIRQIQWNALIDGVTRPTHIFLNGIKIPATEMFDVGGTKAPYPGHVSLPAKERISCRCQAISVIDPDAVIPFTP